jgi:hypothetical protein
LLTWLTLQTCSEALWTESSLVVILTMVKSARCVVRASLLVNTWTW